MNCPIANTKSYSVAPLTLQLAPLVYLLFSAGCHSRGDGQPAPATGGDVAPTMTADGAPPKTANWRLSPALVR